jgi:hypothetical protein
MHGLKMRIIMIDIFIHTLVKMVLGAYIKFSEPKRLPSEGILLDFSIVYDQQFKNRVDLTMTERFHQRLLQDGS